MSALQQESLKGNWRTHYGYTFLSSLDLEDGQEQVLTIEKVTMEDAIDPGTKKQKKLLSCHLIGTSRILALNATNAKAIAEVVGSPNVSKWKNKNITITKKIVKAFGKMQPAIRIKKGE